METKVYKTKKVVSSNGTVYEYDYRKYKDHACEHMRANYIVNKPQHQKFYKLFSEKTRTCTICNETMNYYSMCNHLKSKKHLAEVEKQKTLNEFLNRNQFLDNDSDSSDIEV